MTISLRAHYEWYWNQESCFSSQTPTPESCFWSCENCLITLRTRSLSKALSDWFSTYLYTREYCPSFNVNFLNVQHCHNISIHSSFTNLTDTFYAIRPLRRHKETCEELTIEKEISNSYTIEIYQSRLNVSTSGNSVTLRQHEIEFKKKEKILYSNIDSMSWGRICSNNGREGECEINFL